MRQPLMLMFAAAALGLTACGGSSKSTSTAASAAEQQASSTTAATVGDTTASVTATTPASVHHKRHRSSPAPAKATATTTTAKTATTATTTTTTTTTTATTTTASRPAVASASQNPAPQAVSANMPPKRCLLTSGLVQFHFGKNGVWSAKDRASGEPLFVDGPYKTKADADKSAQSLAGVEIAQRGGFYEVTATLRSHLQARVGAVARCLATAPKSGALTF